MRWWPEQNLQELVQKEAPGGAIDVEMPVANVDALANPSALDQFRDLEELRS